MAAPKCAMCGEEATVVHQGTDFTTGFPLAPCALCALCASSVGTRVASVPPETIPTHDSEPPSPHAASCGCHVEMGQAKAAKQAMGIAVRRDDTPRPDRPLEASDAGTGQAEPARSEAIHTQDLPTAMGGLQCPATEPTGLGVGEFGCSRRDGHEGQHEAWALDGIVTDENRKAWTAEGGGKIVGSPDLVSVW